MVVICSSLKQGPPESVGMDPIRVGGLKKLASGWVDKGDTPSLVVLVARRGTIVLHEAFGVRHYEDATATLKPDAIFPTASLTKPMTAALVMCLVEDGLIGLNRPSVEYIPDLDVPSVQWLEEARVADLLSHTSGIVDLQWLAFINAATVKAPDLPPPEAGQNSAINRRIRLSAGAPLARRPGTAMIYSDFGYLLLADIVRRVSGQPFWQFARSRLFEPFRMRDSGYRFPPELSHQRVYCKPGLPGTAPIPGVHGGCDSPEYDELDIGNNGVTSTAHDLAAFLQMLLNEGSHGDRRVLSRATVAAMTRPQLDSSIPFMMALLDSATGKRVEFEFKIAGGYGYGLFLFPRTTFVINGSLASASAFGHSGYHGTYMWADPEYELLGVFLSVSPGIKRGSHPALNSELFMNAAHAAVVE